MKPMRITMVGGHQCVVNPMRVQWACPEDLHDGTQGVELSIDGASREVLARHTIDEFEAMWAEALRDEPRGVGP